MAFKGSFLGFSYGTDGNMIHSSDLRIVRTSDGSRYSDGLLPTFKDVTSSIEGSDGMFYFGTNFTQKQFSVSFAFDDLTDIELRQIRQLFGEKGIHQLIFDEMPYKKYNVRINGTPNLKYIAFDSGSRMNFYDSKDDLYESGMTSASSRLYKGEGTISFVTYEPYARSVYKYKNQYNKNNYYEWINSVKLKNQYDTQTFNNITYLIDSPHSNNNIFVYNPGDLDTDFKLYIQLNNNATQIPAVTVHLYGTSTQMKINQMQLEGSGTQVDVGYVIDTKLHIIQGYYIVDNKKVLSGNIYNKYIAEGDFFKIPHGDAQLLDIQCSSSLTEEIEYGYLFY